MHRAHRDTDPWMAQMTGARAVQTVGFRPQYPFPRAKHQRREARQQRQAQNSDICGSLVLGDTPNPAIPTLPGGSSHTDMPPYITSRTERAGVSWTGARPIMFRLQTAAESNRAKGMMIDGKLHSSALYSASHSVSWMPSGALERH